MLLSLVKYPSLTEKAINLYGDRQYTFIVDKSLTKTVDFPEKAKFL